MGELRSMAPSFVASGPSGVAVRTRLKQLTSDDEKVLRLVGARLGSLASKDLKARCRDGLSHSAEAWAVRRRELTPLSSSRWAGSITKATHDQWSLARRGQSAYMQSLDTGVRTIEDRLSLPVGQKGTKQAPGGYRSRREWHVKSRRLRVLEDRLAPTRADRDAQVRLDLTRLPHRARTCGVKAIAVEDLDFAAEKTRENHGRRKRFRQLISGMPTGKLRARLSSMAGHTGVAVVAVDPAYTSRRGAQHWQKPLTTTTRRTARHEAGAVAIGGRAQGHPIRRRTTPPPAHRRDEQGHRSVQAGPGVPGREGTRPRIPGPRTRS
ncbi:transposase, partial [Streptomyces sp. ADMS]|nr:transposase [Streptomyces sp. ADMS]